MLLSSLVEDMLLSSLVLFGLISKLCVQYQAVIINPDKTKVLLLGTPQMLARVPKGFGVTLLSKESTVLFCKRFGGHRGLSP